MHSGEQDLAANNSHDTLEAKLRRVAHEITSLLHVTGIGCGVVFMYVGSVAVL